MWHDKSIALNDYMFSIVVENDIYDTYFTEKITDCFATGTVPLYYGPKSISDYFNTEGIIFLEGSIEDMCETIKNIDESEYHNRKEAIEDNLYPKEMSQSWVKNNEVYFSYILERYKIKFNNIGIQWNYILDNLIFKPTAAAHLIHQVNKDFHVSIK